jgi:23S rRNA (uracil1939-C5)-methyltransferase
LLEALGHALGDAAHSLWWNGNPERTNVILGPHWRRFSGASFVRETIGGARVFFPPGAFGQSHLELADRLVARVHESVPDGATVTELHAGCGAIGLGLASRSRELRVNERSPDGLDGLRQGIAALPSEHARRVRVLAGEAAGARDALDGADVVIVDPPRKGIDAGTLAALCEARPARLVYVSCDPGSLERDLARLRAEGRYRLSVLEAFALFPWTEHVETFARLER